MFPRPATRPHYTAKGGQLAHLEVMKLCVRAWLSDVRQRTVVIEDLSDRIRRVESALTLRGVRYDTVGASSPTDSAISDGLAKLQELRLEWSDKVEECADYFREAYAVCGPEYPNRYIVWLHDCEGMTWDKVARRVYASRSSVCDNAIKGYTEIYEVMPEEWRRSLPNAEVRTLLDDHS